MAHRVVCLPGDGVGPEVMSEAVRVLMAFGIGFQEEPFGGAAIDQYGRPLPDVTLTACRHADAVLVGAVGGPRWYDARVRPEQALIRLRKELDVFANLRPAVADGIDLLIVRELVGGLYYGGSGRLDDGRVFDTCVYTRPEIERIAHRGFELARTRRHRLISVDKANVLETSRLWREVVTEIGRDYPDVAAGVTGGLGFAASASLGASRPGIFEPVHGSAPDIAGTGTANPTAMLRSLVLCLEYGLDEPEQARALEAAIAVALERAPTADVGGTATTREFGDAVLAALEVPVR